MQGDTTALNRVQALYGDFTDAPKSIADAISLFDRVSADFASLPSDVKEKFDNDPTKFISSLGSPEFMEKMAVNPQPVVPAESVGEVSVGE